MHEFITNNLDLWTAALLTNATAGRNGNGRQEAYGIKKLRELILELAVMGKLVPQDPNDEPATVLLAKIGDEKRLLIEAGRIREQNAAAPISEEEQPFELPPGWKWTRLSEITRRIHYGYTASAKPEIKSVRLLRITDIQDNVVDWPSVPGCEIEETDLPQYQLEPGDILVARTGGTVGKTYLVTELPVVAVFASYLIRIQGGSALFVRYLKFFFESPTYWKQLIEGARGGAQPNVNGQTLGRMVVPIPPRSEQHRIVDKVDELMALCDQLEQQQTHSIEAHQTLVETLLGTLTRVESQQELTEAWSRLANHFDTLFTTEHSIDQLKQTILQLAVMGKLVPQDPNDEPASVLLKKIAEEKGRLIKEGIIKEQKSLPVIDNVEEPFPLREGWKWAWLGAIATFENGDRSSRYPNSSDLKDTGIPFFGAQDMVEGKLRFDNGLRFISEAKFNELSNGKLIDKDMVMLLRGTVGKMATFRKSSEHKTGFINAQMLIVRLIDKAIFEFFNLYSSSNFLFSQVEAKTTGTAVRQMPAGVVAEFLIPMPPLKEQYRIVAKVDELMGLCDALKARLAEAQTTQIHLADAIVEQAVA
jgi:type I restriction enzyme S subunit